MSATVTQLQAILRIHVTEDPGVAPSGVNIDSVYDALDQFFTHTPATAIPASRAAIYKTTFSGDTVIDCTAAQGSNGTIDASGKKLRWIVVDNQLNDDPMTVETGDSNGYVMDTVTVPAGGYTAVFLGDSAGAVSGTNKTIKLTGENGQTPEVLLVFG